MKLNVKLFGTLRNRCPEYAEAGIALEFPEGATVSDLLSRLEISQREGGVVSSGGVVLKPEDELAPGADVSVFQPVHGG